MNPNILDLIDFNKVDSLLEGFNKATGFVTAILDLDGNVLSKSGWREICTEFHRKNPESLKNCTISDTVLANQVKDGEKYHFYQCLNGLVDVAVPIIIKGEHIANLFSGQFFFEQPDNSFFIKQSVKFGFDKVNYLKSLEKVPVLSKEKVKIAMDFLLEMTQLITEITSQKYEQTVLNDALKRSEFVLNETQRISKIGGWEYNVETGETFYSDEVYTIYGLSDKNIFTAEEGLKYYHPDDQQLVIDSFTSAITKGLSYEIEVRFINATKKNMWLRTSGKPIFQNEKVVRVLGNIMDITERKLTEDKIQAQMADLKRYNFTMVDRELKMIQLKQEINDYCKKLNLPDKYNIPTIN